MDDKMLTSKIANGVKGNRLPLEFLESREAEDFTNMTTGRYKNIVNKLAEMKMISDKKQERLLLNDQNDAQDFINQNLVDTRYVISQFVSILKAFNKVNGYNTHVVCMNSSFTKLYSKYLNFKKNRDFGDQHHAYDAACLCIADACLNEYFPNYDLKELAFNKKDNYAGFSTYNEFIEEMNKSKINDNQDSRDRLKSFIFYAFKKAFNQDIYKNGEEARLLETIKGRTPLLSWKVEKNYDGKLFDATLYPPKGEDDKSVLSLLGINNKKRSFDSVYPVAVDFYKVNHKHYAISIPLAIVDNKGNINKSKYLELVKKHYKATDLIDEAGNLKIDRFRFRAFKHDILFDTETNEAFLFNLGSIAIKKMEIQPINIFSYYDIYNFANDIRNALIKEFNIKTFNNTDGVDFDNLQKEELVDYLVDELNILDNPSKHKKRLIELTLKINSLNNFAEIVAYQTQVANKKYAPPTFDKQWLPVADNNLISNNPDAEYAKLKYYVLGVRFNHNNKGKILVIGPSGYSNGGYKLIKKEKFYWNTLI